MYNQQLLDIYRLHVARGGARHGDIERHLCLNAPVAPVSVDDQRNEPSTFEELFSGDGIRYLEALYQRLMWQMQGVPFAETSETLGALSFLQVVLATALWRYRLSVGPTLDTFARQYDRLDTEVMRRKLHVSAQSA